jgi:hypothetical protein
MMGPWTFQSALLLLLLDIIAFDIHCSVLSIQSRVSIQEVDRYTD